jgi:hypothetical protein
MSLMHGSKGLSISRAAGRCWRRVLLVAASAFLAAALSLAPSPARAAEGPHVTDEQKAASLKARADAEMDGGAFADAITSYRASYEISRNPALLYNIGNAYERLGDYPRALAYLEQFSIVASLELRGRVPALASLIATVRGRLGGVVVSCNVPGARVFVRGTWRGTTPLPASVQAMPGPAIVEVLADGYKPYSREVFLTAGKEIRLDATLVNRRILASPVQDDEAPPPARGGGGVTTQWWFWTGVGLVVAGGATAAVLALSKSHSTGGTEPAMHGSTALLSW